MSTFCYELFMIFCSSDLFSWLLLEFLPYVVVYSVCVLIGVVIHG